MFDRFILERTSEAISFSFGVNSVYNGVSIFIMRPPQETALCIVLRLSVPSVMGHRKFILCILLAISPSQA